ncbi:hypothetical protein [Actinomadura rudentiformis]|uniref:Arsenate reductase n=1 Tax=Actinomadura rudentiformis TaxID=359158 RepID=A0A6H9YI61_9ACTN|nr:hypothetical protein [Actinomadura rudentiformis]KAB2340591.1 hypothetical protein F8566_44515 [Actinomadura rudentiformis]
MGLQPGDQRWASAACTLPTAEQPLREAEFDALFGEAVTQIMRVDAGRVRLMLRPDPEVAGRAAELATRETGCCSFFTFTLTATGGALALEVSVADQHAEVLEALTARAAEVMTAGTRP